MADLPLHRLRFTQEGGINTFTKASCMDEIQKPQGSFQQSQGMFDVAERVAQIVSQRNGHNEVENSLHSRNASLVDVVLENWGSP
jgi:hypothetical protein